MKKLLFIFFFIPYLLFSQNLDLSNGDFEFENIIHADSGIVFNAELKTTPLYNQKRVFLKYDGSPYLTSIDSVWYLGAWWRPTGLGLGLGYKAIESSIGANTVGIGHQAASQNEGNYFTGVGNYVGLYQTGDDVSGVGYGSLEHNIGDKANGFGRYSLKYNTANFVNGIGGQVGHNNKGGFVCLFGHGAGFYNRATYSVGVGDSSLFRTNTSSYLTSIGYHSGYITGDSIYNITNSSCVGANSIITASNQITLGDSLTEEITTTGDYIGSALNLNVSDTTVTAVLGKIVYQSSDSTFYGCRSTVAPKKWYPLN